jgi:uncharacterized membrane protein (UPF0127 family)
LTTLNKTPKVNGAKTAWVRKNWRPLVSGAGVLCITLVWAISAHAPRLQGTVTGHLKDQTFTLEVADTPAERMQGLSNRPKLADGTGMLFVFDRPSVQCFWMKDMRFNLDIIWVDADKKVVYIEPNVSPSTYPHSFCPNVPAQYVVEVNAGVAQQLRLEAGDTISF